MDQQAILDQSKAMDLETYREIFLKLSADEFAELFYRMNDVLGVGTTLQMSPDSYNKFTELFWQVSQIADKHISPERKAFVMDMKRKTTEEIENFYKEQNKIVQ